MERQTSSGDGAKHDRHVCNVEHARSQWTYSDVDEVRHETVVPYAINQVSDAASEYENQGYEEWEGNTSLPAKERKESQHQARVKRNENPDSEVVRQIAPEAEKSTGIQRQIKPDRIGQE